MNRALRYAAIACAALAFVQAVRLWSDAKCEVTLTYRAPVGELTVTLLDEEGERLRRTVFGGADRSHIVPLPPGSYIAELSMPAQDAVRRRFQVRETGAIELSWWKAPGG
ncbi:MAG: hypothetical protein KC620_10735 [Myxococcales bacterium]|nr:hypothetical protein [Myxococcales bacterium]